MNMISTGAFLSEMDASNKQPSVAEQFAAVWEKKNAKAARAGGVSLMALSLAACGSSSTTTSSTTTTSTTTTTTTTPVSEQFTTGVDALTGGAGADSFVAQMDATATLNTAGLLDTVAGGEGADTLTVINTTANAMSTQLTAANITGIEKLVYSASAGGNLDLDSAGSATEFEFTILGATDISDVRTSDTVTIVNGGAAMDTTITYNATNVANAADAHTVAITSMTAGSDLELSGAVESVTLDVNGAASLADLVFDAATTGVTIDAAAALTVATTLTGAGVTTYTVTGAGKVDLDAAALGAAVTTYNAAGATGVQSILAGATNITITGGAGDDVIDMGATLTSSDTIDGGAGADTLRVDTDSLSAGAVDLSVTNVETLRLDNTGANAGAIQMDNSTFTSIRFDEGTARGGAITLTDLPITNTVFDYTGAGTLNGDPQFNGVVYDYDTTTAIAAATINVSNGGKVADDIFVGKIDMNLVTAITVNGTEIGQAAADELTIDEIEADNMTDLTVTADGEVIISDIDGDIVDTLDFSGADGGVAITAVSDAAAALVVTMGDGNDSVEITDTASAVTIDLGAGNDTFISDNGSDTITTGTGIDTVRFVGTTVDTGNIITDFTAGAGGDVIDVATSANDGGTALTDIETFTAGADDALAAGLTIIDNGSAAIANADALTVAGILDRLNDLGNDGNGNATDHIVSMEASDDDNFVLISDGTDTALVLIVDATGDDTVIETADIHIIATFQGVSDAGTFTAANFADFI